MPESTDSRNNSGSMPETHIQDIFNSAPIGVFTCTPEGRIISANAALVRMFGYQSPEELIASVTEIATHTDIATQMYAESADRGELLSLLEEHGQVSNHECRFRRLDGTERWGAMDVRTIRDADGRTDRKQAEATKEKLQAQLTRAQKMESVGRLAGGVAHDFNNILTTIMGTAELILGDVPGNDPLRSDILRMIPEDIAVQTALAEDLDQVEVDESQIEQVIMNLAINARDAMPAGGRMIIETANVDLDATYTRSHVSVSPGSFVMLSVSDTGIGMSKEVQEQVFEPFFTTKDQGKGTGLGLSTVYGIVKQSNGSI
ncbi:MAG: PAS domain-containing protein [Desulfovermiculus sp.]|nr:PAS domain-containing protein [Desulfovermiculus sp.]